MSVTEAGTSPVDLRNDDELLLFANTKAMCDRPLGIRRGQKDTKFKLGRRLMTTPPVALAAGQLFLAKSNQKPSLNASEVFLSCSLHWAPHACPTPFFSPLVKQLSDPSIGVKMLQTSLPLQIAADLNMEQLPINFNTLLQCPRESRGILWHQSIMTII
jgi:hypothetical protein